MILVNVKQQPICVQWETVAHKTNNVNQFPKKWLKKPEKACKVIAKSNLRAHFGPELASLFILYSQQLGFVLVCTIWLAYEPEK